MRSCKHQIQMWQCTHSGVVCAQICCFLPVESFKEGSSFAPADTVHNFFPLPPFCDVHCDYSIFQHRILLIFIPPLLVFGSLSASILKTLLLSPHFHPLSFPFLSFLYAGAPWGPLFFFQIRLSAFSLHVSRQGGEWERRGGGERGVEEYVH